MGNDQEELKGPDLTQPFMAKGLPVGEMIGGHAFGELVLLAHTSSGWLAVGGKCTHYGASLSNGLLVGDRVRCPWHHACFDLRTGAAACAPALLDLPVFDVEAKGDTVRITRKRPAEDVEKTAIAAGVPLARAAVSSVTKPASGPASVLIVGGGAAGNACAEMLRREGYDGPLAIIDPDRDAPYDRPNISKDYLAGSAPEEWLPLHPPSFYADQKIELVLGAEVVAIDPVAHSVKLSDGNSRSYGKLVLATGASPIRLDIPGGERILYLRSLVDCKAIQKKAEGATKAVVIGASFIGLEVGASLRARGLDVTVVAPEKLPLEKVMGPQLGELVKSFHESKGVKFMLGRSIASLRDGEATADDGTTLSADIVIAGVGVRPNVALAEKAGLAMDKGILVNEFFETSYADIVAIGDVARWPDAYSPGKIRVEHWVVAERHGQSAARNMLGKRERFADVPYFWSMHFGELGIHYTGHAEKWDEIKVDGDLRTHDAAVSFLQQGKLLAMATLNRDRQNLEAELSIERSR